MPGEVTSLGSSGMQTAVTPATTSVARIFLLSGGVALFLLIVFTTVISCKRQLARACRLTLIVLCVICTTGFLAFLLVHLGLGARELQLTLGDQVVLIPGAAPEGIAASASLNIGLHRAFCDSLILTTDRPGLLVWTVAVAPHLVTNRTYGLLLETPATAGAPLVVALRLSAGDQVQVLGSSDSDKATVDQRLAIYQTELHWQEWLSADEQQPAHEICCAWWPQQAIAEDRAKLITVEKSALHRLVFRQLASDLAVSGTAAGTQSSLHLRLTRSIYQASECDPVVCDSRQKECVLRVLDRWSILDFRIAPGSEQVLASLRVQVECQRKDWAIALIVALLPLGSLLIAWFLSRRKAASRRRGRVRVIRSDLGDKTVQRTNEADIGERQRNGSSVDFV
ncbi:unnamed protein product [Schistocephalus solidus]|uniref:DUF5730 domain-containing protein n=1 Tax=Schistocephalus solidus TaxID=70667 RepID=A0A183SHQ3_SCHSO|nr:unnamed protein product [Schistocephalus solidus]